jgi:hypothetical protein
MRCGLQILAALFIAVSLSAQPATMSFYNSASFSLWTNNASGTGSNLMSGANAFRIGLYLARGTNQPESMLGLPHDDEPGGVAWNIPRMVSAVLRRD